MSYLEEHGGMGIWEQAAWEEVERKKNKEKEFIQLQERVKEMEKFLHDKLGY